MIYIFIILLIYNSFVCFYLIIQRNLLSKINDAIKHLEILFNSSEYLNYSDTLNFIYSFDSLTRKLNPFFYKLLPAFIISRQTKQFFQIINNIENYRIESNNRFITNALVKYCEFFNAYEKYPLTERQREAILTDEDNTLIIAGAGTGKTSTITAKAVYLIKFKNINPNEILLLAFTKKACNELEERILNKTGYIPDIKTFHKLGLDIIKSSESRIPKLFQNEDLNELNFFSESFNKLCENDLFYDELANFILNHYYDYTLIDTFNYPGDYYKFLKSLRAFDGKVYNSLEKYYIANYLFLLNVEYKSDFPLQLKKLKSQPKYQPAFYLPEYKIYIDCFPYKNHNKEILDIFKLSANSQTKIKAKEKNAIRIHYANGTRTVCFYFYELTGGNFFLIFLNKLKFLTPRKSIIKENLKSILADKLIPLKFVKLLTSFLNIVKTHGISLSELENINTDKRRKAFNKIFIPFYKNYQEYLDKNQLIDFNDMLIRAKYLVESKKYVSSYKYILVDEFQDISRSRYRLINAIKTINPVTKTYCVGDDWQSIFRFTGSDIQLISDFSKYFGYTKTIFLDLTFRFNKEIAEISEKFVLTNPHQIAKELKTAKNNKNKSIEFLFYNPAEKSSKSNLLKDIIAHANDVNLNIFIIGRYNFQKDEMISGFLQQYKSIKFLTAHSSKGLESDYVILLDVNSGNYGFPSELIDDKLLNLAQKSEKDFPYSEERRLFYVALTRAREKVYIIYDKVNPSTFVEELININIAKNCPKCISGKMLVRTNKLTGKNFYSCSNYPLCMHTDVFTG